MSSPNEILELYDQFVGTISESIARSDASTEEMETLKADLEKATKSNSELMMQLKKKDDEIVYMTKQVGVMTSDAKGVLTKLATEANAQKAVLKLQYEINAIRSSLKSTERELRAQQSENERLSRNNYQLLREKATHREEFNALQKRRSELDAEVQYLRRSFQPPPQNKKMKY